MANLDRVQRLMESATTEGVVVRLLSSDGSPLATLYRNDARPVGADAPDPDVDVQTIGADNFEVRPLTELGEIFLTL